MMPFIKKNWAMIVIVVLVLAAGYYLIVVSGNNNDATVSVSGGPASTAEATFINLASQLEPIHFDTTILSDPRFTSLVDIHTSIVPETGGRTDPFAPLSGVSAAK